MSVVLLIGLALLLAASAVFLILHRWQYGIILIFSWLFLGDLVRKLIPGQPPETMLIGDVLLLITYFSFLAFLVFSKKDAWSPSFLPQLLLFVFITLVGVVNSGFVVGAVGLRSYLWYIPLFLLGYEMFKDKKSLLKFFRVLSLVAIPLFALALIQVIFGGIFYFLAPFSSGHTIHAFFVAPITKISSLFGSGQRYGMVSMLLFFLGLAFYHIAQKRTKQRVIFALATLSALGGVVLSASRSAFVLTIIGFILFMVFSQKHKFRLKSVGAFLGVFLFVLAVLGFFGATVGLFHIVGIYNVFDYRVPVFLGEMKKLLPDITFFGEGTGVMSQGLDYIGPGQEVISQRVQTGAGETGIRKLIVELGVLGLVAFYLLWGKILFVMRRVWLKISDKDLRYFGLAVIVFLTLILIRFTFIHHQVLGDVAVLVPLWFSLGVFFGLKKLKIS